MQNHAHNHSVIHLIFFCGLFFGFLYILAACGPGTPTPIPTPDMNAQQTIAAATIYWQLTSIAAPSPPTITTLATSSPSLNVDTMATVIAEGVKQTLTAETQLATPTFYPTYTPYPTSTERPTDPPPPTRIPPIAKPISQDRVTYWIECDPDGTARIFVFTAPYSWPQVNLYSSMSGAKGEMSIAGGDIQPKIVNPHNRGVNSVDYTLVARFSDGREETHYLHYGYPGGCSPTQH